MQHVTQLRPGEPPFSCRTCSRSFWYESSRTKHELWHLPMSERHPCANCKSHFLSQKCLERHMDGSFTNRRCTVCGSRHAQCSPLSIPEKMVHAKISDAEPNLNSNIGGHKCVDCGRVFARKTTLVRHSRQHIAGQMPLKCSICGAKYSYVGRFQKHMQMHDAESKQDSASCVSAPCKPEIETFAETEIVDALEADKIRLGSETGLKLTATDVESTTVRRSPKTVAMRQKFGCPVCSKEFLFKCRMERHAEKHADVRPYQCATCGKLFKRNGDLHIHSRFHDDEKQYACTDCGLRFRWKNGLDRHIRVHTGEQPYLCIECGRTFADKSHYNRHMRKHRGGPFERLLCNACGKTFADKLGLTRHTRSHCASLKGDLCLD